ncbi:MAG: hypothetical protein IPQ08_06395 [Chitinophagaceae bacterium]|nr:hypothetical protein [Chitinophagaceae bacterium]
MNPLLKIPSTDFNGVRDGRNSLPLYIDIDLTLARSIGANTQLVIEIAANSFYADADTSNGGNATVHFQDTNLGSSSAPFFVSPGFIANVGFTKLLIENTAQAGKRMRIFYGVDIDFQAGVNSSIAISGDVKINNLLSQKIPVYQAGIDYGSSYKSNTSMAANTPDTVFSAAANVNGAIVWLASLTTVGTSQPAHVGLVAKATAPASIIDGDLILCSDNTSASASSNFGSASLKTPIKIPAGKGLYAISTAAEQASYSLRSVLYTLL